MKAVYALRSRSRAPLPHRRRGLRPAPEGSLAPAHPAARRPRPDRGHRAPAPRGHRRARSQEMLHDTEKLAEFEPENEIDFSYADRGLGALPRQRLPPARLDLDRLRAIPFDIQSVEELDLPEVVTQLAEEERGIILLTGTTGSGKSTTLAAMIDHINRTMRKHIVTIEDPIEFLHRDRNSIINQREVGAGHRLLRARAAPRAAPGPGRDPDRRDARRGDGPHRAQRGRDRPPRALHAAHGRRAETINRIIDFFPPHQQQQARAMIAGTLRGVVSQRLVPTADGDGRVACCEVLMMTGRVNDMISTRSRPAAPRGHRRGRLLRDADLRPGPARAPQPAGSRWRTRCARPPTRTTSSCWSRRSADSARTRDARRRSRRTRGLRAGRARAPDARRRPPRLSRPPSGPAAPPAAPSAPAGGASRGPGAPPPRRAAAPGRRRRPRGPRRSLGAAHTAFRHDPLTRPRPVRQVLALAPLDERTPVQTTLAQFNEPSRRTRSRSRTPSS